MSKVLYEVDPYNRIVIKKSGSGSRVKKFRRVVSGRFKVDSKNKLSYEVYKSSGTDIPQKIKFSGDYSLDKKHNLVFDLDKWNNQCQGNRLRLKTRIMNARRNEMVFLLSSKPDRKKKTIYTMRLKGAWHADRNNRLSFGVKRDGEKTDALTFFNAWEINKNNEIIYNYGRDSKGFTLRGNWRITDKYSVGYAFDKGKDPGFNFRSSLAQIVPRGKKTYMKFAVAIDVSKRKRVRRNVVFSGKLKFGRGNELILEAAPKRKNTSLKLTRGIFDKKGLMYIESFLKEKESYLGGGIGFRW